MNPFDLRGPEFLIFYLLFTLVTLLMLYLWRRTAEAGPLPPQDVTDPYLYACLQGGPREAVRAAVMTLIERDALTVDDQRIKLSDNPALHTSSVAIEQDLLSHFAIGPDQLYQLLKEAEYRNPCIQYEARLREQKLLPDDEMVEQRRWRIAAAVVVLAGVAIIKVFVALARGHTNIGFLILFAIAAVVLAFKTGAPRRTQLGDMYLDNARVLFSGLREKAHPVDADLLWMAALFGMAAVPQAYYLRELDRRPAGEGIGYDWLDWGDSGGGSSDSSSSSGCGGSSGCSGSCGGGCGGGCGGCGGCGS